MFPCNKALQHPAYPLLAKYATSGCPAHCGPHWTLQQLEDYIEYNNHSSAQQPQAAVAVRAEVLQKVEDGLCQLVPWNQLKTNLPLNLKVAPLAAIPHKTRDFRMILDLSFQLQRKDGVIYSSVNSADTTQGVPAHSQAELGNVIPRILWTLATSPHPSPFLFAKVDIKDGFWRMRVRDEDSWNFAYVLPKTNPTDPTQLVIPSALQMGWTQSPPYFLAATETARDLAAEYYKEPTLPPHPLEHILLTLDDPISPLLNPSPPPSIRQTLNLPPKKESPTEIPLFESYVDDFIIMLQTTSTDTITHATRSILHAINDIFPPPAQTGSKLDHPISIKKLQEEGRWSTQKEILGWLIDGQHKTITITDTKCNKIYSDLTKSINQPRLPIKKFESIKGKLNWLSDAVVTGKPLLGDLDNYFHHQQKHTSRWTTLPPHIIQSLRDWRTILHRLKSRPTSVHELIPTPPAFKGTSDASKWGAGGVWFTGTKYLLPTVWFVQWPTNIQTLLDNNTITIAVLELAAILLQWLVIEHAAPAEYLHHVSVATKADNTNAVSWTNKFRCSQDPTANRLLKALTLRLHKFHAAPFNVSHIAGVHNKMADVASREHPTNPLQFLSFFSHKFPPPQNNCWHLCTLPKSLTKQVFSLIQTERSKLGWWNQQMPSGAVFGNIGPPSWIPTTQLSPTTFQSLTNRNVSHCWEPSPNTFGRDTTKLTRRPDSDEHKQLRWRYEPSPRPSCWTEGLHQWSQRKGSSTSNSADNSTTSEKQTPPP
jgi:hypothetical protein